MKTAIAIAIAAACGSAAAQEQSWNYKSYLRDRTSGQFSKERFVTSKVTVVEKDGSASFEMIMPGKGDPCVSNRKLPAQVERSAETITVTVQSEVAGCEPFRYVIRNDGSGGVRQHRRNDAWVADGFDHDLTPVK